MGIKSKMLRTGWALAALSVIVLFQNCEFVAGPIGIGTSKKVELGSNNGQPYDGKPSDVPYVASGFCPDGTIIQSRLIMKTASEATLYRENCKTGQPRELKDGEVSLLPGDNTKVSFAGRIYTLEKPAIPLPGVIQWFIQINGTPVDRPAGIYIVDMFETSTSRINQLKTTGHTVICRMSGGTKEGWAPDANKFPASATGNLAYGQRDEWFVDIRTDEVRDIMIERLDLAKTKGCQGIDFDAVDGYKNTTGFALSEANQLEYNQWLAFAAHDRNFIMALNNVPALAAPLSNVFDLAIGEQCYRYGDCDSYKQFTSRGKPVLAIEYSPLTASQCAQAKENLVSLAYFNEELDGREYGTCQ